MPRKIVIVSDHAGFSLKKSLVGYLKRQGYDVLDLGPSTDENALDYPLKAKEIAKEIKKDSAARGIAICGTGIGISIVVNKFKGIRCGLCSNEYTARMCRQHNDAQVMAMGARVTGQAVALSMVDAFLDEPFAGDRHAVRVNDIKAQEEEFFK